MFKRFDLSQKDFDDNCGHIVNLSSHTLSVGELSLLSKGLTFVPSPSHLPRHLIVAGARRFVRSVKLEHYFRFRSGETPTDFVPKSSFCPPKAFMPPNIQNFCREVDHLCKNIPQHAVPDNLSSEERLALHTLRNNSSLLIRKADKGASTVLMDRTDYIREAESQLHNPRFYVPCDGNDPTTKVLLSRELNSLLDRNFITPRQFKFFCNSTKSSVNRVFYTLPKIHKPRRSWLESRIPPGRPIVSDTSSMTYQIAKYISKQLETLGTKHRSYIRDTYHFLDLLGAQSFPPHAALVTMDVQSLYTNIDTDKGIAAVAETMSLFPDPSRPDSEILNLLRICLTHNTFFFNSNCYRQVNGCAMGHPYAVHYANIYMSLLETRALNSCHLQPAFYARFIDDIILIWLHGYEAFLDFFGIFNSTDPSIKFTYDYNSNSIAFLDVRIYKGPRFSRNGILDTRLYFKPTDTHQLLHKSSFHPKHTFDSIVKSQVLRFFRICNNTFDFNSACQTLFSVLKSRGYSER